MKSEIPGKADYLAKQISQGDAAAFRMLYDLYIDRIAGFIFVLSKSRTATEELTQECFIKLWTSRIHLTKVRHIESYLFSIAKNSVLDYLRKLQKNSQFNELIQQSVTNQHRLHEHDLEKIINEALSQLGPEKRKIFFMSKMAGMSHDEIAEALQLSKSTVKNHLSESLRHLREYIKIHPESGGLLMFIFFI